MVSRVKPEVVTGNTLIILICSLTMSRCHMFVLYTLVLNLVGFRIHQGVAAWIHIIMQPTCQLIKECFSALCILSSHRPPHTKMRIDAFVAQLSHIKLHRL